MVAVKTQRAIRHTYRAATVETHRALRQAHYLVAVETRRAVRRAIGHTYHAATVETYRAIRQAHYLVAVKTRRAVRRAIRHAYYAATVETYRAIRQAHYLVAAKTQRAVGHAHRATTVETHRAIEPAQRLVVVETCSDKQAHRTATQETAAMMIHVVLFRLRPGLSEDARDTLAAALTRAAREIPSIRRARVGSRVTIGRAYEQLMTTDYSFAALLEFDDREGLNAYLDHGAHEQLAQRFYASVDHALTYNFEMWDSDEGIERIRGGA